MAAWFLYLIECSDGSIYTGITTDVGRRWREHASGKGARYTRMRPPRRLLAVVEFGDRRQASQAEYALKRLAPEAKRDFARRHGADLLLTPDACHN
ncbi:GIY-YIG nuclease family protein [Paludibacterium yongneupense]|uniref:GIY-YIG nuclease family protein n=1 Tax=Paludibacterium yongneupense TaxID=400061 RepID=UPI0003F7EB12|nr:GIY-YIG nuclease family protein [Paludibacterium yongneupense]